MTWRCSAGLCGASTTRRQRVGSGLLAEFPKEAALKKKLNDRVPGAVLCLGLSGLSFFLRAEGKNGAEDSELEAYLASRAQGSVQV